MSAASGQTGRSERGTASRGHASSTHALPWVPQLLVVYAVATVIGLVLLIVGYAIVSNEVVYDDQEPGITLAVLGAVLSVAAGAFLLLAGRRVVTRRRVAVLGLVPVSIEAADLVSAAASSTSLVGGEGMTKYHRADCPLAAGRDWPDAEAAEHDQAGRQPCGVCRP